MERSNHIESAYHPLGEVIHLLIESVHQLIKSIKGFQFTGLGTQLFAVDRVYAVVHNQLQALEKVDVSHSGPSVRLAADTGLNTAVDTPIPGLLQGAAGFLHHHGNHQLVIKEGRSCHAGLNHFQAQVNQVFIQPVEIPDRHGGL